ncbi:hypothetical protein CCR94_01980 [Rhodoblastus sphagnicola]|uniref:Terminase n=2 Tax=Rhodoblastus sphagnicola TaxID=333368 RepID=A0A2S6NFK4_9HYPH|nr:hypothetical protein CCR94_01980 [Rhodoblastus sphagnicola]
MPMREALDHPDIFGTILPGESWVSWRVLLIAGMGEELTEAEREIFRELTGRDYVPGIRCEEFWAIVGRRGGKTRAIAVLAAYIASLVDFSDILAPGERASLPIISASLYQAQKCFQYLDGIYANVAALKKLVTNQTTDTIQLSTRIDIECRPASFRTIRGGTAVAIICDEIAFWRSDNSANPDAEILNAARPMLATTGGLLAAITSPYAKSGEVWQTFKRDYGATGDPLVLVAKAASRTMNPELKQSVVDRAYERDAASASAEYGAEFRQDVETFINPDVVDAAVVPGRFELPPVVNEGNAIPVQYVAFVDPAGGSGADAMTLAIAHCEQDVGVLDLVREVKPPFSPESAVADFAAVLASYGLSKVTGDRWGGEFVREQFQNKGITYEISERVRSDIYKELLPLMNSRRVELLDNRRLTTQLCNLERRTARGGRDSIDHAPGAHDDLINSAAGAIVLAAVNPTGFNLDRWMRAYA